jgi:CRP-like cAMP-binding protein
MYVISSGKIQISRRSDDGSERVVGILGEGDAFGERALLMKKPYSETALTLTPCELTIISREKLDAVAARYPSLQRTINVYVSGGGSGPKTHTGTLKRKQ